MASTLSGNFGGVALLTRQRIGRTGGMECQWNQVEGYIKTAREVHSATLPFVIEMGGHWHLFECGQPDTPTQASPVLWSQKKGLNSFTTAGRGTVGSGSGGRTTAAETKSGHGWCQQPLVMRSKSRSSAFTSEYTCDGIQTRQEWFFQTQDRDDVLTYDCQHTIRNCGPVDLVEYAQFFACYTAINREKIQFYWSSDKQFKTFESLGGKHLDAYIVALESTFDRLGRIPHALRGGGVVADTWHQPVLVGHPSPKGWRHIVFTEPAMTAGLASGMGGIAMDYIAYPGTEVFVSSEAFSIRIRHHIVRMSDPIQMDFIERLWEAFDADLMG